MENKRIPKTTTVNIEGIAGEQMTALVERLGCSQSEVLRRGIAQQYFVYIIMPQLQGLDMSKLDELIDVYAGKDKTL